MERGGGTIGVRGVGVGPDPNVVFPHQHAPRARVPAPSSGQCRWEACRVLSLIAILASRLKGSQALRLVALGTACLLVGAVAFSATQHVPVTTGLYWAITTATTVGYGDVTPKNPAGRVVAVAVMLTTIPLFASAFALFAGAIAASHVRRLLGMVEHEPDGGEVMILGWHPSVPHLCAELVQNRRRVVVVTTMDTSGLPGAVKVIRAEPTNPASLHRAKPERAAHLLIASTNDADSLVTAVLARQAAPAVPTMAIAQAPEVAAALADLGIAVSVSADELLAHTLAKSLEAPHAGELLLRLMDHDGYQLSELPLEPAWVGQRLSAIRRDHPGLVLGAVHDGRVTLGVANDPELSGADRVLVVRSDSD